MMIITFAIMLAGKAGAQQICSGLLTYAARDELDYDRDTATSQSIYREHCEGSSAKRSSSTTIGLEAVIKAVPAKFNLGTGNVSERLSQFCKIASDQNIMNEKVNLRRSSVVREALDAFNRCVELSGREVLFEPMIGSRDLNVAVRKGRDNVTILGVEYNDALQCKITGASGTTTASSGPPVEVTDSKAVPIFCSRVGRQAANGAVNFPSTSLTILTDRGNFRVPVAEDSDLPLDAANDIDARITALSDRLTSRLAALETRLNNSKLECLSTSASVVQGRNQDGQINPPLYVNVPEQYRLSHVIVGGSCEITRWYQDRVVSSGGGKKPDGIGWQCRAGDAPNTARPYDMVATVHYCKVATP